MTKKLSKGERKQYSAAISPKRLKESSHPGRSLSEEAASDKSRILYSSAFRRLQQKTQVFPLSRDAAVRSRLTHSLEVADVGSLVVRTLNRSFFEPLDAELQSAVLTMVETGCLMHDIGNPPFGHFAEVAIQKWFEAKMTDHYESATSRPMTPTPAEGPFADFLEFDGNPQGIRIVSRLQGRTTEERLEVGMNLTCAQILTSLKYSASPTEHVASGESKPGFFHSEAERVERIRAELKAPALRRYPLSYIVEAADDIAYSLSDIEDGIDAGILTARTFFETILAPIKGLNVKWAAKMVDVAKSFVPSTDTDAVASRDAFIRFKTEFTPALIGRAAYRYQDRHDRILDGSLATLFEPEDEEHELLEVVKELASKQIYSAARVEQPMRMGYAVVEGLLDRLGKLLSLSVADFDLLMDTVKTGRRGAVKKKRHDPELLVFGLLPDAYMDTYRSMRNERDDADWEWFCRAHLIVDYVSGMTDQFALRTFQALAGVDYDV